MGKWTDVLKNSGLKSSLVEEYLTPIKRKNPLQDELDQWGKLDGTFNNIMNFPTPIAQDPIHDDWLYFSHQGTKRITEQLFGHLMPSEVNEIVDNNLQADAFQSGEKLQSTTERAEINHKANHINDPIVYREKIIREYVKNVTGYEDTFPLPLY